MNMYVTIFNLLFNIGLFCIVLALLGCVIILAISLFSVVNKKKSDNNLGKYIFTICIISMALLVLGVVLCGTGFLLSL